LEQDGSVDDHRAHEHRDGAYEDRIPIPDNPKPGRGLIVFIDRMANPRTVLWSIYWFAMDGWSDQERSVRGMQVIREPFDQFEHIILSLFI
jgi:hypothetical protein